jgi:hypothetical protein
VRVAEAAVEAMREEAGVANAEAGAAELALQQERHERAMERSVQRVADEGRRREDEARELAHRRDSAAMLDALQAEVR